jgi:flagellar motor switch protein FliM
MSDVMSQNDIDNLLAQLSTGELDVKVIEEETQEKRVRKYDFTRPDKFAKDQLRTLEIIHENFARLLNNFLSGYLRTFVDVQVLSVESLIYTEFANSVSTPSIIGIVDFSPLEGQMAIDMSPDIAFTMIERILGGSTRTMNRKENRSLTEIEMTLVKTVLNKFINLLKDPWGNIIELKPKLSTIETNSQFAQIVSPTESIALVTFLIKIGEVEGMLNFAIPHFCLEPILPNLSSRLWFTSVGKKEMTDRERGLVEAKISKSSLGVAAVVGRTFISIQEFLGLSVGDVIILDRKVDEDFEVYVEDELKYFGRPGLMNKNISIKITGSFVEGDDLDG